MNPLLSGLLRVVLHACGLAVTWLPRAWELALGRVLGKVLYAVDPKRKKIGLENMRRCLPELGPAGWEALLRRNYEHYGVLALELLHMFSPAPGHYPAYVKRITRLSGREHYDKVAGKGKGVLLVTAHMANWEVMCSMAALSGMRGLMITRRLKPQWLHDWMAARREETGIHLAYQPRTLPAILKMLRSGGLVGFVMDQYHAPPMGTPVPFFGTVVDTLAAVGSLSQRTGAGVLLCSQVRKEDGLIHCDIQPYDLGEAVNDPVEATRLLALEVERFIRENPAQWLWIHRRFKNLPASSGTVSPTKV